MLRALAQNPGPAGLIGLVVIGFAGGTLELDRLDAGVGLPFGVLGVFLGEDRDRVGFRLLAGLAQNVALRVGKKIEWDAKELRAKNCPEADQYIRREYRKGWELKA